MFTIINPAEVEQLIVKYKGKGISVTEIKRRIYEAGKEDVMQEN